MAAAFFGAAMRRPFFVLAAALCARRALLLGLLCPAFLVPWTIVCKVELSLEGPFTFDRSLARPRVMTVGVKVTETPDPAIQQIRTLSQVDCSAIHPACSCSFLRRQLRDCRVWPHLLEG